VGDRESRNAPDALDAVRLAREVLSELDLELVLRRVLDAARELSEARYAALGVTDESRADSSGSSRSASTRTIANGSAICRRDEGCSVS
jgi:GAF domain-containing protein